MSSGWHRVVDCQYLFVVVWPKHFSLGARPRIHMHRHILVYVRSALMSIISSFWIMLNYCSVGGALVPIFFFFTGTGSRVPIQVVLSWSCTRIKEVALRRSGTYTEVNTNTLQGHPEATSYMLCNTDLCLTCGWAVSSTPLLLAGCSRAPSP